METLVVKVAAHAGIEALGGLGVGCMLLLCHHEHFHGRLAFVNRIVHSRAYRSAMVGVFWLATALATVLVVDPEVLDEGLAVFALAVGLHLALETAGGAGLMAAFGIRRGPFGAGRSGCEHRVAEAPSGVRARLGRLALLAAWYLAFAVAAVTLIPFGHGG